MSPFRLATRLPGIIDQNNVNPVEGLYQQGQLLAAQAVDLSDPVTFMSYSSDLNTGRRPTWR